MRDARFAVFFLLITVFMLTAVSTRRHDAHLQRLQKTDPRSADRPVDRGREGGEKDASRLSPMRVRTLKPPVLALVTWERKASPSPAVIVVDCGREKLFRHVPAMQTAGSFTIHCNCENRMEVRPVVRDMVTKLTLERPCTR